MPLTASTQKFKLTIEDEHGSTVYENASIARGEWTDWRGTLAFHVGEGFHTPKQPPVGSVSMTDDGRVFQRSRKGWVGIDGSLLDWRGLTELGVSVLHRKAF